jgi:hypothetical protein
MRKRGERLSLGAGNIHDPGDITGRHYSREPIADGVNVECGKIGPCAGESFRFVF